MKLSKEYLINFHHQKISSLDESVKLQFLLGQKRKCKQSLYKHLNFLCIFFFHADKELDIIEMAVYGDVIRPGNQCRCRTVAEMLGKVKAKTSMAACELPYKET